MQGDARKSKEYGTAQRKRLKGEILGQEASMSDIIEKGWRRDHVSTTQEKEI